MGRKKRLIIPIFIPFAGCTHRCVFCDQERITGISDMPDEAQVRSTVDLYLKTWKRGGPVEVAFYGGNFTGLSKDAQAMYLDSVQDYIKDGLVSSLRVSTRPDRVDDDVLEFLGSKGVRVVELGAQSFDDSVLSASGRGHTAGECMEGARAIKANNMVLGLQLMPGLPKDTLNLAVESAKRCVEARADFVRVYPTLVIRGTPLHAMYEKGLYAPWSLDKAVEACRAMLDVFNEASIPVIRMGLHASDGLLKDIVAGPWHPNFRSLVFGSANLPAGI